MQVELIENCSILAAVGQRMASTPGVSATLFTALAKVCSLALSQTCKVTTACSLMVLRGVWSSPFHYIASHWN